MDETDPMSSPMKAKGVGELGLWRRGSRHRQCRLQCDRGQGARLSGHAGQADRRSSGDRVTMQPVSMADVGKGNSMLEISTTALLPTPVRALLIDDPAEILGFAVECFREGAGVALATLVEIRGGAAPHSGIPCGGRRRWPLLRLCFRRLCRGSRCCGGFACHGGRTRPHGPVRRWLALYGYCSPMRRRNFRCNPPATRRHRHRKGA